MRRLALNIGNTRIAIGKFASGELVQHNYFLHADLKAVINFVNRECGEGTDEIAICSVVPAMLPRLEAGLKNTRANIFSVTAQNQNIITNLYSTIGADRVASAAAAFKLYSEGRACIVLDFGTSSTMAVISPTGEFLGGFITLGLGKTFLSLHQSTAQLPDVQFDLEIHDLTKLGNDTTSAIAGGCVSAHLGLIEKWIKLAKQTTGENAVVIATGGYSKQLKPLTDAFDIHDRFIVLKGIDIIASAANSALN